MDSSEDASGSPMPANAATAPFVSTGLDDLDQAGRRKTFRLLAGLSCGAAAVVLDFFIVLVCLPAIQADLGATAGQLQLIVAAYAIANGSFLVLGGKLGDLLGRRRMFDLGVSVFALVTLACAIATSAWMLIGLRVLQGVAGAVLQPQVLGLLTINSAPADRQRVFGIYAATLGAAGILAQLVGGVLVEFLPPWAGWRACFAVGIPLCLVALVLSRGAVEGVHRPRVGVDPFGALLLVLSLGGASCFLTLGRDEGWPPWAWITLATSIAFSVGFLAWVLLAGPGKERLIPAGVLGRVDVWSALLTVMIFFCGVASFYFVFALELRRSLGLGASASGVAFGWLGLCFVVASSSKRLKKALGGRWASAGAFSMVLGHCLLALAFGRLEGWAQLGSVILACLLNGLGLGLLMGGLVATAVSRFRQDEASLGGGLVATTQQIGNSTGLAAVGLAYFGLTTAAPPSPVSALALLVGLILVLVGVLLVIDRKVAAVGLPRAN